MLDHVPDYPSLDCQEIANILLRSPKSVRDALIVFARDLGLDYQSWIVQDLNPEKRLRKAKIVNRYNVPTFVALLFMANQGVPTRTVQVYGALFGAYYAQV